MIHLSSEDFSTLESFASRLSRDPRSGLTLTEAREAVAVIWEFESWAQLVATRSPAGQPTTGVLSPRLMMKGHPPGSKSRIAIVARQIGHLTNYGFRYPELSKHAGAILSSLYGYSSLEELAHENPLSQLNGRQAVTRADQDRFASENNHPPANRVFGGLHASGFTVVVGSLEDDPIGFTIDQIQRSEVKRNVVVVSSNNFAGRHRALSTSKLQLLGEPSFSTAIERVLKYLRDARDQVVILAVANDWPINELVYRRDEILEALKGGSDTHLVMSFNGLGRVPMTIWKRSAYQVMLAGAAHDYPVAKNPLKLRIDEANFHASFADRSAGGFTYMVKTKGRTGELVYDGLKKIPRSKLSYECTA